MSPNGITERGWTIYCIGYVYLLIPEENSNLSKISTSV